MDAAQLERALRNADAAGDDQAARILAGKLAEMRAADFSSQAEPKTYDPTEGMTAGDKFWAGMGKAMVDVGRGTGQLARNALPSSVGDAMGLPTNADIAESKRLDAPLMATDAGRWGRIAGDVVTSVPSAAIPGANTLKGAGLIGAGYGLLQPTGEDESKLKNAAVGGAFGPLGLLAGRGLAGVAQGVKGMIDPFYEGGRDAIARSVLQRFATDPTKAQTAASGYQSVIPGVSSDLAEASLDPGLAKLKLALGSADPQVGGWFAQRALENNAARVGALRNIAGDDAAMDLAKSSRDVASKQFYKSAEQQTATEDQALRSLMERPSMQKASNRANQIAQERGAGDLLPQNVGKLTGTVSGERPIVRTDILAPSGLQHISVA